MALSEKQQKTLSAAKEKLKVMSQVAKLEKDISSLQKKLEIKEKKVSELVDILDGQDTSNKRISPKEKAGIDKTEDSSDLFTGN